MEQYDSLKQRTKQASLWNKSCDKVVCIKFQIISVISHKKIAVSQKAAHVQVNMHMPGIHSDRGGSGRCATEHEMAHSAQGCGAHIRLQGKKKKNTRVLTFRTKLKTTITVQLLCSLPLRCTSISGGASVHI